MIKHNLGCVLFILVTMVSSQLTAQPTNKPIVPDAQGNYLSNLTNSFGDVLPDRSKDSPGSLWRVVTPNLHCRKTPSTRARSLRVFPQGTVLQADVGRAGSDEVYLNALDEQQKPWMLVRSRNGEPYQCFVRAHQKFIAPFL